jgi:O-acetyl-ADP-ribose deacetylase (regulator of RNase III)
MDEDARRRASIPVGAAELAIARGDITTMPADVIVNAANSALQGGGGVDGAIHRRGGPTILDELRERYPNGSPTGTAVVTAAGELPARWVVHAVGPRYRDGLHGEEALLRAAYEAAMILADGLGAASITLPAISCGIYGYPLEEGARVGLSTVRDRLVSAGTIERATFVLNSDDTFATFERVLSEVDRLPGT